MEKRGERSRARLLIPPSDKPIERHRTMILCAVDTDMRWSEISGLRPQKLDFVNRKVLVTEQLVRLEANWSPSASRSSPRLERTRWCSRAVRRHRLLARVSPLIISAQREGRPGWSVVSMICNTRASRLRSQPERTQKRFRRGWAIRRSASPWIVTASTSPNSTSRSPTPSTVSFSLPSTAAHLSVVQTRPTVRRGADHQ